MQSTVQELKCNSVWTELPRLPDLFDSCFRDLQLIIQVEYRNYSVILYEQNTQTSWTCLTAIHQKSIELIQVQYRNHSVILYEQNYSDFLDLFDSYPSGIYRADAFRYSTGIIV